MSEEYRKFVEKHMIKIPEEKAKVEHYGETPEEEKQKVKEIFVKIRERDKPPK